MPDGLILGIIVPVEVQHPVLSGDEAEAEEDIYGLNAEAMRPGGGRH